METELASRTEQHVEWIRRVRLERARAFGAGLFSDPAWDILLELFAAKLHGRAMKFHELETDAPRSTLARWATVLEGRGFISCRFDPRLPADLSLELSETGTLKMSELLQSPRRLRGDA